MAERKPTNAEKLRSIPWQIAGGVFNTVFVLYSFAGSVFILFLDALGLDKARIGFLVSLVPFCGIVSLLVVRWIARFGFKRTFLTFYLSRKLVIGLLLLTPLLLDRFGIDTTFTWVAVIIFVFAVLRALAFSALHPWEQDFVPAGSRGKITGLKGVTSTLANITAIAFAGWLIGRLGGLAPFIILIGIGVFFGIASGISYAFLPGGGPLTRQPGEKGYSGNVIAPLRDRNYLVFLLGVSLTSLSFSALNAFVPLFMAEEVGLALDRVVYLGISSSLAALLFYYLWGWAADRYGSKPVMICGLGLKMAAPLGWVLLPLAGPGAANVFALAIAFLLGVANTGWLIGHNRYLYVSAVPVDQRGSYLAVFMAAIGVFSGLGPLLGGLALDFLQGLPRPAALPFFTPYLPLFAVGLLIMVCAMFLVTRVRGDGALPTRRFLGMFIQGNPFMAFESLLRFGFDGDEQDRVGTTERIGQARNPLNVNELGEILRDPSFNVRYEALISASRMPPGPELTDHLLTVLGGRDPDLAGVAAWALGKIGDPVTILPLREILLSGRYPLLRARCARALGMIGDRGAAPMLARIIRTEHDDALRVACAAALGMLGNRRSLPLIMELLAAAGDDMFRQELVLALVRIGGRESLYVRLLRRFNRDPGTTLAQLFYLLRRRPGASGVVSPAATALCDGAIQAFSADRAAAGALLAADFFTRPGVAPDRAPRSLIVAECARRLRETGGARREYVLLAVHLLLLRKEPLLPAPDYVETADDG